MHCKKVNVKNAIMSYLIFINLACFTTVFCAPFILEHEFNVCTFQLGGILTNFSGKPFITGNGDYQIQVTLCAQKNEHRFAKCKGTNSVVCITRQGQSFSAGTEFAVLNETTLISRNGHSCSSSKLNNSYIVVIKLVCDYNLLDFVRLESIDNDGCTFTIQMLDPNCPHKCAVTFKNTYDRLFLQNFTNEFLVVLNSTKVRRFFLNVCGNASHCGFRSVQSHDPMESAISSCEFTSNNETVPLSMRTDQYLEWNESKGRLQAVGQFKKTKTRRSKLIIAINCVWEENLIIPPTAIISGTHSYIFNVYSNHGCVKLPQKCQVTKSEHNMQYEITRLNRPKGWKIHNISNEDSVFINVCGPLALPKQDIYGKCAKQHSQVCNVDQGINWGSIMLPLEVNDGYPRSIKAVFIAGSVCASNATSVMLYRTVIHFFCSFEEGEPTFSEVKNCTMFLVWRTSAACPLYRYSGAKCMVQDFRGTYINVGELSQVHSNSMLKLSNSNSLVYSVCSRLNSTCNGYNNASICLRTDGNKELVIGFDDPQLNNIDGQLSLDVHGESCGKFGAKAKMSVFLQCNFANENVKPIAHTINSCDYSMTITTPLGCLTTPVAFTSCIVQLENGSYVNLTPLRRTSDNYVIKDKTSIFTLNVCESIVTAPDALCVAQVMVCMKNLTEPDTTNRYKSLGVPQHPEWSSSSSRVVIKGFGGDIINELSDNLEYAIEFICAPKEGGPKLDRITDGRNYEFIWPTPHACAYNKTSGIPKHFNDCSKERISTFEVHPPSITGTKYVFNVCQNTYTITNGANITELSLSDIQEKKTSVLYILTNKSCSLTTPITSVVIYMKCGNSLKGVFHQQNVQLCIATVSLGSSKFCSDSNQITLPYEVADSVTHIWQTLATSVGTAEAEKRAPSTTIEAPHLAMQVAKLPNKLSITDMQLAYQNKSVRFTLNFNGTMSYACNGYLCRESVVLIDKEMRGWTVTHNTSVVAFGKSTEGCMGANGKRIELRLVCLDENSLVLMDDACHIICTVQHPAVMCTEADKVPNVASLNVMWAVIALITLFGIVAFMVIWKIKSRYTRKQQNTRAFRYNCSSEEILMKRE